MVITIDGKNNVRDQIDTVDVMDQGGMGTDSTAPSEGDTKLNDGSNLGTTNTIKDVATSKKDKQINMDYLLPSTDGNGVTFKEFGLSSSTQSELFNRQTYADLIKTSQNEFQISFAISIK